MQLARRGALVISLVLIVGIVVGVIGRRSQLASERDSRLMTASALGIAEVDSVIASLETVARAGGDPADAADAISGVRAGMSVCVITATRTECAGDPALESTALVAEHRDKLREGSPASDHDGRLSVYQGVLTVDFESNGRATIATIDATLDVGDGRIAAWVTSSLPLGVEPGTFVVADGIRQIATPAGHQAGLYVVASTADGITIPGSERTFYVIALGLLIVLLVAAGIASLVEQRSLLERATFDPLTKLPNRSEFETRTEEILGNARRTGSGFVLMLFDLNGFKAVNDTHGHRAGDELLQMIARRLESAVRSGDVVGRWGGDEFVVAMPGVDSEEMGGRRGRELAEMISGRMRVDSVTDSLRVKVSVGVAIWPTHGDGMSELMAAADAAMYQAKRHGLVCSIASTRRPRQNEPTG